MKASIHCPKHGLQQSNPNTEHAIACDKCFPRKIILHLCADTGSDTKPYKDAGYEVILVGKDIGVENFHPQFLGEPQFTYQPWEYGSPWTKHTALWGKFNIPEKKYTKWEDVPKIIELYTRPGRGKPSLAFMHKSHKRFIREFDCFEVDSVMEFRSLNSQKFAQEFYEANV